MENTNTKKYIVLSVVGFLALIIAFGSFGTIDAGNVGIKTRFSAVVDVLPAGLYFKVPFIESVRDFNIQTQKEQVNTEAASSDLQTVNATVAMNYNINAGSVESLYTKIGLDYSSRVIDPAIQEAVKAATAKHTAEELVTKRSVVRDEIKTILTNRLQSDFINVTDVAITNFDFSKSFNQAIEAKVTAEQNALAAKNKLEQVKFEAQQQIETAKAQAESIKIQAQAVNSQGGADYVQLQAIAKWDGKLPTQFVPGSALPFINLK